MPAFPLRQAHLNLKKVLECGTFLRLLNGSLESQVLSFAIPVAAVLPWSDSFLQEYKSGFLKAVLPRTDRRRYVEGKVFSVVMSGFLVGYLQWLPCFLSVLLYFIPWKKEAVSQKELLLELIQKALRVGITGSILSTFGICAVLGNSPYMAYGIPFVTYYFGIILHERYFKELIWFLPGRMDPGSRRLGIGERWVVVIFVIISSCADSYFGRCIIWKNPGNLKLPACRSAR